MLQRTVEHAIKCIHDPRLLMIVLRELHLPELLEEDLSAPAARFEDSIRILRHHKVYKVVANWREALYNIREEWEGRVCSTPKNYAATPHTPGKAFSEPVATEMDVHEELKLVRRDLSDLTDAVRALFATRAFDHADFDRIEGLEHLDKVIDIDQSPIGRTPRSNPATYTGAFTPIRDWFAGLPEAGARGYKPGRFSFNVKGGRCEACQGDGVIKIEMHFLPDVYVTCDVCHGKRYNRETLAVTFKGKSIADVLDMTVEDAVEFFKAVPPIRDKMAMLAEVGLGYIKVGQQATTLSGGEAQRVKLAKELSRRATGNTLYILDEPTTGLHFEDVRKLLEVLHALVDQGNSVVVIEHNLDVIKTADWIIDMGPEGGPDGGQLVAQGTPEQVARVRGSHTGRYLAPLVRKKKPARKKR